MTIATTPAPLSQEQSGDRRQSTGRVQFEEAIASTNKGARSKHKKTEVEACPPPHCKNKKLNSRELIKYCSRRRVESNALSSIVKTFIDQMDILRQRGGFNIELVVCTMLQLSSLRINRMLYDNGLESWMMKRDEESTLAKTAILNQLANGCFDYSTELRRRCNLLQVHMENSDSKTPNPTEII